MKRGLVIGKFYPPHYGHRHLIDTAASQVDHLDVLVCDLPEQVPPAHRRAEWLRSAYPEATVRIIHDIGHDDDSELWARYTIEFLGYAPDVVFSSEDYGPKYAKFLGAAHVMVDRDRKTIPVSGTQVRNNPLQNLEYMDPQVRAHYIIRICVVGAESSGTTTLSQDLAAHYKTVWVPEYGRLYTERLKEKGVNTFSYQWRTEEFVHIALQQQEDEDRMAEQANRILICDTDALATCIWHQRYMGTWSPEVEEIANRRRYALYLLTDCDIPFEFDGVRDGQHIRPWMTKRFSEELTQRGYPWILLKGPRDERLQRAVEEIDKLLV